MSIDIKTLTIAKNNMKYKSINSIEQENDTLIFSMSDETNVSIKLTGLSDNNLTDTDKSKLTSLNDVLLNKFQYVNNELLFNGKVVNQSIDISNFYNKAETMQLINSIGKGMNWKSSVNTLSDLPTIGNEISDTRVVTENSHIYVWNNSSWIERRIS